MNKKLLRNVIAGSYALVLHIIVVFLLLVSFDSVPTRVAVPRTIDIIQATVVDEQQILDGVAQRQEKIEEKARLEKEVLDRKKEKLQIQQQKRKNAIEHEKKRLEKQKREANAKLKAVEKNKKAAELKKRKKENDKKKIANIAKKLKAEKEKKAEKKKKKQAEEKRRRQAEEKEKKAEAHRSLQEGLALERREKEDRRISGVVNKYIGMIGQRIKRYWSEPANAEQGMECILRVILFPNGNVQKVSIVKSSGNANFDRSAQSAVYKAAPWPQPTDPKVAAVLRDFKFVFRPQ
jgi:colicin import membrane protein